MGKFCLSNGKRDGTAITDYSIIETNRQSKKNSEKKILGAISNNNGGAAEENG